MRKKGMTIATNLCMLLLLFLGVGPSVLAESEIKEPSYQPSDVSFTQDNSYNYERERSYYFYDMLQDYFKVQAEMRRIYGDQMLESTYAYKFATLAQNDFDRYYQTDDIKDLESAMANMYNHHVSIGKHSSFDLNYRIASNNLRAYVPSSFSKDNSDIIDFFLHILDIVYPN